MEYKDYTVRYMLDADQIAQLERITSLYNNVADVSTSPESLFNTLMQMGSRHRIQEQFDFFEHNFTANQPQN